MRRWMIRAAVLAAALTGAVMADGDVALASSIRECGNPTGPAANLTTRATACSVARKQVRAWYRGGNGHYINGWA